jgi:hypothetical protein
MPRRNSSTTAPTTTTTEETTEMNATATANDTTTAEEAPVNTIDTTTETVDNTVVTEPEIDAAPTSASGLIWSAPPAEIAKPKREKGAKRAAKVAELVAHPMQWAIVASNLKYTTATTEWRKEGLEVRHGKPEGSDLYTIWARYNPEYTAQRESGK